MSTDKQLPYNNDAEKAVLGSILLDGAGIRLITLKIEDFFAQQNQYIFEAMLNLEPESINQITIASELNRLNKLISSGGVSYLSQLVASTPTSTHLEYYADIVSRCSFNRRLISASDRIMALGYDNDLTDNAMSKSQDILNSVYLDMPVKLSGDIKTLVNEAVEFYKKHQGEKFGILTGIDKLDSKIGGLYAGESIVLAANTSVGKTTLAVQMLMQIALRHKVLMFSEEMTQQQIINKMVAIISKTPAWIIYRGEYDNDTFKRFIDALAEIYEMYARIEKVKTCDMMRVMIERYEPEFVIVDYLQKVRDRKAMNKYERVSNIANDLTSIAKDYNIPLLALSQLSRESLKDASDKRPKLNYLRDSGEIEESFDAVWALYRDSYFQKIDGEDIDDYTTELWILKDRLRGNYGKPIYFEWDKDHECYAGVNYVDNKIPSEFL